ncbi:LTA synthase family protein [Levilactobacillus bambusae]|uniref:Sulfatase N-terminal domain-containing protein n=1 Tax=Levilactobacillus bambusae TaxID=2024736 RepID=A0A2V1MZ83_9LACO|nr:LTA synthase family protein [Levilactobacillus bambusae]PWF99797.1 hypothetical protein DCM90_06975 [Levilactobacillus bambusae]
MLKNVLHTRYGKIGLLFILLLAELLLSLWLIQAIQMNSLSASFLWLVHRKKVVLVTLLICFILDCFVIALFNRVWLGNALLLLLLILFEYINYQKMALRNEPFLPSDLLLAKQTKELSGMINVGSLASVIIIILIIIIGAIFIQSNRTVPFSTLRFNLFERIGAVSLALIVGWGIAFLNHPGTPSNVLAAKIENDHFAWNLVAGAKSNGPIITFINNVDKKPMNEPDHYSKAKIEQIVTHYKKVAANINQTRAHSDINQQTLIYVLSESFSDPKRVPGLTVNHNPVANINRVENQSTAGLMLSSGYGGGTANMEYMTDTSFLTTFFTPSLSTPFTQLVPTQSHVPTIAKLFKTRNAIHTNSSEFYSRNLVYKKFGFQSARFSDSTGTDKLKYHQTIQKSDLISDEDAYKDAEWQVNQEKDGQFISLVTMQNHLPFTNKYNHDDYGVAGPAVGQNSQQVKNYVEGIHLTDQFTREFLARLDSIKKPITVLWYGDHLAGIWNAPMAANNIPLHETDYFIYSNRYARQHGFSIGKQKGVNVVSPNTFSPLVLQQMNQRVTPYYGLMTQVLSDLPATAKDSQGNPNGLMVNDQNQQVTIASFTPKQQKLYEDYKLIQYDQISGRHYAQQFGFY